MKYGRSKRLGSALKKEISLIIQDELKDPRIGFVTVTGVEVSNDLKCAKVFFTVYGDERSRKNTVVGLNRSKGYLKHILATRLRIKSLPNIIFELDQTEERAMQVDDVLERLKQNRHK